LAAWFRLKYPSSTVGSIASSAPVIAQVNFQEYMDVVGQAIIELGGQKCYDAFETAANKVASYAREGFGSSGMQTLEKDFTTCSPIRNAQDLGILYTDLMGNIQGVAQYNGLVAPSIQDVCTTMLAGPDAYAQFVTLSDMFRQSYGKTCEDANWEDSIAYLSSPTKDPANMMRPWTYQTCSEFGYYQTTTSKNQPFHSWVELSVEFSRQICNASFSGWKADPETAWTNQVYGDVHIGGTNIVFPSGTIDPWHALSVTNHTASLLPQTSEKAIYIEGTSHCRDMYAPSASDPPSIVWAQQVIAENVAKWLN